MSTDTATAAPMTPRELLVYTVEFLRENPERHEQGQWMTDVVQAAATVGPTAGPDTITAAVLAPENECGTAGCVAGWGALFAGYHQLRDGHYEYVVDENGREYLMQEAAREAFALSYDQAENLFAGTNEIDDIVTMLDRLIDNPLADLDLNHDPNAWTYDEAEERYIEWLNENHPDVTVDGWTFSAVEILQSCDDGDKFQEGIYGHAERMGHTVED
jgi:hypothetical protein